FQAEDGIRDRTVTGVQTCALPIFADYGFGTESAADFTNAFQAAGGKVTGALKAPLGSADFLPFVTQLKAQPTKDIYSFFSGTDEIGRASCRERVEDTGVEETLKKK